MTLLVMMAAGRRRSCTSDDCSRGSGSLQILSGFRLGFGSRSKLVSRGSGVVRRVRLWSMTIWVN
ncbi:hypothetical protein Hanom_Chr10g00933761 [Helianthus anomalus]